jgi:hypothetical protein
MSRLVEDRGLERVFLRVFQRSAPSLLVRSGTAGQYQQQSSRPCVN